MKPSAETRTPSLFRTPLVKRVKCGASAVHFLESTEQLTAMALCGTEPLAVGESEKKDPKGWRWVRTCEPKLCQACLSIASSGGMRVEEKP